MTGAGAPQPTPADLGDAVARARASYDRTPYESLPYPRLQPARMAAAALWAGVEASDVKTASVLEIGCASGGHLIPLAAAWPKARFLGVDVSPVQIAAGRDRIARAGLANIALDARSLHEIGAGDGAFDYIICHGLLSWVAEPLREALMRVVAERLAPNGVAMVSFNVLPGWRLIQVARDSLMLHARLGKERDRQALDGRALVEALSAQSNSRYSYGRIWRDEARQVFRRGDAYLAHEFYEDVNEPLAFLDFSEALDRHGLAYLGDCNVAANLVRAMAPAAADTIAALAAGDERAREQYIDIFSGRVFREALVVRRDRADAIHDGRGVELDRFHFVAASGLAASPPAGPGGPWRIGDGDDSVAVADGAAAHAIRQLIARLPRSSTLEDLAPVAATEAEIRKRIAAGLVELVTAGLCAVSSAPIVCATRLQERPRAWPLAASDALAGAATASLSHAPVTLEPLQRLTLPLLDGTRTRADLVAHALGLIDSGELTISGPDGPVADRASLVEGLGQATDACLADLVRLALIEGE